MIRYIVASLFFLAGSFCAIGADEIQITVATYNLHHGAPMSGGSPNLSRQAAVIRAMQADVVALQEMDVKTRRTQNVDQPAELARLTQMHHAFGAAMPYRGGEYGNAILSKTTILSITNHPLPSLAGAEPRAVVHITFRPRENAPLVHFLSTHLDHASQENRYQQALFLNKLAAEIPPGPVLLLGDMNASLDSPALQPLSDAWDNLAPSQTPTYPADSPRIRIDHILQRKGSGFTCQETQVIEEPSASDHRPLRSVLRLSTP